MHLFSLVLVCSVLWLQSIVGSASPREHPLAHIDTNPGLSPALRIYSSSACGEVYATQELSPPHFTGGEESSLPFRSYSGGQVQKFKRSFPKYKSVAQETFSYRTPEARLYLAAAEASTWNEKNIKNHLLTLLADQLEVRALQEFRRETAGLLTLNQTSIKTLLAKLEESLFTKQGSGNPMQRNRVILALYPQLHDDIIANADDNLRPLLCHFEHKQHNIKIARRWSNVLVVSAVSFGVASIIVGSQGLAVPALVISAGTTAALVGTRDIAWSIYSWKHKEKAGKAADRFKLILKEVKHTLANFDKKALTIALTSEEMQLRQKLAGISTCLPKERQKAFSKISRSRTGNRLLILLGALNAGFNGVNFTGDATILAHLPGDILSLLHIL